MKRVVLLIMVFCFALGLSVEAKERAQQTSYNIIYIGNSITYGAMHPDRAKTAPPAVATAAVAKKVEGVEDFRNCGRSGATTVDFLPALNRDFKRVEKSIADFKAAEQAGKQTKYVFSFMLGTNDSACTGPTGAPVSNDDYKKNLLTIISRLRELCPDAIFVLHRPVWYSPNTYNNARYLVEGLNRVTGYINILTELANENADIYLGDCESYDLFKRSYEKLMFAEEGNAGTFYLHPTVKGAKKMGQNWANAIIEAIEASSK